MVPKDVASKEEESWEEIPLTLSSFLKTPYWASAGLNQWEASRQGHPGEPSQQVSTGQDTE